MDLFYISFTLVFILRKEREKERKRERVSDHVDYVCIRNI